MAPIAVDRSEKGKAFRKHYFIGIRWKTIVLLLFPAAIFISSVSMASEGGFRFGPRDKAFGVHFIDGKRGWIVGDRGLAVMTADGGESWQGVTISEETFKDIFFIGEKGWIVGDGGLILHTDNGGKRWSKQSSNVSVSLMSVLFLNRDKGFTVGADGTVLRTVNGGSSWEAVPLDWMGFLPDALIDRGVISINLYDVFFLNDVSGWVVGDCGTVLYTEDGGNGWGISNIGLHPPLFSISFKDGREGWAVGQNGFSIKTLDRGMTWEKASLGTEESLYRVRMYGDYGAIVGDHGVIFTSNNGVATWVKRSSNLKPPFPWLTDAWIFASATSAKVLSVGKGVTLTTMITRAK